MDRKNIKVELKEETIRALNYIQEHYWFGMFKQIGLAENNEVEYILRNALDDFRNSTNEEKTLFNF
jgi:hypothetical protein